MRFLLLTPGTGHFYCGSCLRDDALANALRASGHDVLVAPLYLPLVLEHADGGGAVHMGGINMYLQQKSRLFGRLPRPLANLLDRPGLLRWASKAGNLTDPADLGAMTLSMLRGEDGNQVAELDKLIDWLRGIDAPDVVVLSNAMLCGMARRIRHALGRPLVVTLQGEAPFLDALPEPFSRQAWQVLAERARDVDAFVPVSRSYGTMMVERLGVDAARVHPVYNGIDLDGLDAEPAPLASRRPQTIGYLARMCRDKGLPTLVEAFLQLAAKQAVPALRLRVAGVMLAEDRALVDGLRERVRAAGCAERVEFLPNVTREDKIAFLRTLSVLSVPATYGESFGLYVLEANAAGVPVVQPRHGAFPELIEATGGGVLCEPDDAEALAGALERMLRDEPRAQEMADAGRAVVLEQFNAERMAVEFTEVCRMAGASAARDETKE